MKTWMRFGIGAAALVVAIAIGTAAYAMRDDADDTPVTASDDAGTGAESACLIGTTDCNDTPGEGLGQTCLVGTPDCVDADLGGDAANCAEDVVDCQDTGGTTAGMCIEGVPDCMDTVVEPYGDFGEIPAKCAADAVDCVEPGVCTPEGCSYEECTTTPGATPEEDVVSCQGYGCSEPVPAPDPLVDPPMGAPEPMVDPAVDPATEPLVDPIPETQAGEPDTSGCLGVDPCTISSQQMCPPPDCAVSSDGTTTCYAIDPICAAEPPEAADGPPETVECDDTVPPSEGEGSSGSGGSTEPGSTEPQPAE